MLVERGHLFLLLAVIIGTLVMGYSAPFAALCGIMGVVPTALLRASTRGELRPHVLATQLATARSRTALGRD